MRTILAPGKCACRNSGAAVMGLSSRRQAKTTGGQHQRHGRHASREAKTELLVCVLYQVNGSSERQTYRGQELDYCAHGCAMPHTCGPHCGGDVEQTSAKDDCCSAASVTPLHLLLPLDQLEAEAVHSLNDNKDYYRRPLAVSHISPIYTSK